MLSNMLNNVICVPPKAIAKLNFSSATFGLSAIPTRSTPTALSAARNYLAGASVGNYALFGGGTASSYSSVVDAYDTSLTRSTPTALSAARNYLAGASVGNYALFGGGTTGSGSGVVDAYKNDYIRASLPQGSSYNVNSINGIVTDSYKLLDIYVPVTGWIKVKSGSFIN